MKGILLLFIVGAIIAGAMAYKNRNKPLPERLRESADDSLADLEKRARDLREQAKRLSGEAQRRLQDQAHELESRQKELRGRLDDLRAEAKRILERARGD
jgi:hypothetical protein